MTRRGWRSFDQYVIPTLASHAGDEPLTDGIGLWRSYRCPQHLYPPAPCHTLEALPVLPVVVPEQESGLLFIRCRFSHLLRYPAIIQSRFDPGQTSDHGLGQPATNCFVIQWVFHLVGRLPRTYCAFRRRILPGFTKNSARMDFLTPTEGVRLSGGGENSEKFRSEHASRADHPAWTAITTGACVSVCGGGRCGVLRQTLSELFHEDTPESPQRGRASSLRRHQDRGAVRPRARERSPAPDRPPGAC